MTTPVRLKLPMRLVGAVFAALAVAACAPSDTGQALDLGIDQGVDLDAPVRVALLAPLGTGEATREARAQSIVDAARLAVTDLGPGEIDLVVYPTAENPDRAAAAALQAIDEGAEILVGPVFSSSVAAVSPIAADAGIPVLSLSNNAAVAGGGTYVLGLTFDTVADAVLGYAARQEGVSRIGILHTQDAGGEAGRDAIRAAAVSNGVQVVTQASYERSQTGINDAAEAYTDAFINAGLDGLFFTDGGSGVVYAVSFLPYFGLDMDGIQTMSIQPMDGAEFSAERPLRGTLYAVPDPQLVELFGVRYRQAYGAAPDPLASLSYDAVAAVGAMIATAREAEDTAPFDAEDIRTPLGFAGVNGIFRFSEDGALERGLSVMQVTEDGPVMVSPAPQGFGFGS